MYGWLHAQHLYMGGCKEMQCSQRLAERLALPMARGQTGETPVWRYSSLHISIDALI